VLVPASVIIGWDAVVRREEKRRNRKPEAGNRNWKATALRRHLADRVRGDLIPLRALQIR
jgi:hypothetical protein